jgi:hydrogenase expression/formation protein HypD
MKYLDEYRDPSAANSLIDAIRNTAKRPWSIMEVCGGQTHSIVRYGIDRLIPTEIELLHGPGCPVCVTPLETIDRAHAIASRKDVILCSFGDMLRVPGSFGDLLKLKAQGKDIRVIYSPLDAVETAVRNPEKQVVFLAIGFETTAAPNAMALWMAKKRKCRNFTALVSHVLVPPSMTSILQSPGNRVQGFLGPGHVCTISGFSEYEAISQRYRVPIVITGFEPIDLLEGIWLTVRQLERGEYQVENQYKRAVKRQGNPLSRRLVDEIFEICDQKWRGVGIIPKSGLKLSYEYRDFDASIRFDVGDLETKESDLCISGQVLKGLKKPSQCPAFGTACTPQNPLGATMVSSEGACAAYFNYRHMMSSGAGIGGASDERAMA